MTETSRTAAAIRGMVTGFNSVAMIAGGATIRGHFIERPRLTEDDGFGGVRGEVQLDVQSVRVMREDVAGLSRGSTLTIGSTSYLVHETLPQRDGHTVVLLLAEAS